MNTIIDTLSIWTTAQKLKTNGRGRSSSNQSLHGINKLRDLILELAVRGKLVPQNPDDESASNLLKKIASEKKRFGKDFKIRIQSNLSEISEEEKPFLLPEKWEWVRIGDVGHDWGQKTPDNDFSYIEVSGIDNAAGLVKSPTILTAAEAPSRARKIVKVGTVIYSTVRPYLKNICVIDQEYLPEPIVSTAFAILHPYQQMPGKFFSIYFKSPVFVKYVESVQNGIAYPAINDKQFFSGVIPLPPLAEQHRIVAKVDELMALCDELEQQQTDSNSAHEILVETLLDTLTNAPDQAELETAWLRISNHFDMLFTTEHSIDRLKQTILQLAVMGKLTRTDLTGFRNLSGLDEPASELLKKIGKEKARLVKEGKIRKQNPLAKIEEDEMIFGLPENWDVSRLGTFTIVGTGSTPSRDKMQYYSPQEFNWVSSGETSQDFIYDTNEKISSLALKETNVSIYPKGTLIVAMYGQGKTRGQVSELMIDAGTNQACAAVVFINKEEAHRKYLKYFFKKAYDEIRSHSAGGAQPNLNLGKVANTVIPIPPLAEQRRIVAKVDELFAICDALKERINESQVTQLNLADALVDGAVGKWLIM